MFRCQRPVTVFIYNRGTLAWGDSECLEIGNGAPVFRGHLEPVEAGRHVAGIVTLPTMTGITLMSVAFRTVPDVSSTIVTDVPAGSNWFRRG